MRADANVRADAATADAAPADAPSTDAPVDASRDAAQGCATACDDGDACNGVETCVDGECVAGTPVTCQPSDACHRSTCTPATGACAQTLVDGDGDGEAPSSLGACGTDCDDSDASIRRGAIEVEGDGVDQDCDGMEVCFWDGDRDGFRTAATRSSPDVACNTEDSEANASQPIDCNDGDAAIHAGAAEAVGDGIDQDCDGMEICFRDADGDGFRTDAAATGADADCGDPGEAYASAGLDCCDADARAYPGEPSSFGASAGGVACGGWDFDCNGTEERGDTTIAFCAVGSGSVPVCVFSRAGWNRTAPACGGSGSWVTNCTGAGTCNLTSETREQVCR
ncbi:MAG: MopE-related protein [Polyangiales bacterium]